MAMLKIKQDDYAYPTARLRAKEVKLLDGSRFERMLEAATPQEAYKVLTESEYGVGSDSAGNALSFETLLSEEMKKTYSLLEELAPHPEVVRAFQRRHDFFNVKVLLKAEFSNQEPPDILADTGTLDRDTIKRIIRERDYEALSPIMQRAVAEIYDLFSRTRDPQLVDLVLDRAANEQMRADLGAIDNAFLQELAVLMTDITNIKMFVRVRLQNKTWDFIKKLLLDGGLIPETVYMANSDKPLDAFIGDIRSTRYGDVVYKGFELYKTKKNLSGLEKLLDDYLMEYVRSAKLITMGVEPFIAWLFAKEAEIRNVRIIMTGKINGLSNDLIRERLRLVYV